MSTTIKNILLGLIFLTSSALAVVPPYNGGTGVSNGPTHTITVGGAFSADGAITFTGAYGVTFSLTGTTVLALPQGPTTLAAYDGSNAIGTWGINISGNAATATTAVNGVVTTGSYSDPSWITSLAGSKISGNISGNAGTVTNGIYSTDVGTVTNTMLAGSIADSKLSTISTSGKVANSATTATDAFTGDTIVSRNSAGNFAAVQISAELTGNAATATALHNTRAIYGNNFDGTAPLTQIIASTYGGTGNGFTKFSGPTTSEKTFTLPDASSTILTSNAAVTVGQGGTGQTSYTNGQLLIGNTTGNTLAKATLTGTANQVVVTNGASSITLSTPQNIATSSSPVFAGLTSPSLVSPASTTLTLTAGADASLGADLLVTSGDGTGANASGGAADFHGGVGTGSGFGGTVTIFGGNSGGGGNGGDAVISGGTAGIAGTGGSVYLQGGVPGTGTSGEIKVQFSNVIIDTVGKTLKIREGANGCKGTGAVMIAGAVTVSTTCAKTGDIILLMKTANGGTSTTGMPVVTISDGVSFTITGGILDTSTWAWVDFKAA